MAEKHIHIHFSDSLLTPAKLTTDAPEGGKQASEAAATLGHFGGMARASVLSPGRRKQIAKRAAQVRWRRKKPLAGKSVESSNK